MSIQEKRQQFAQKIRKQRKEIEIMKRRMLLIEAVSRYDHKQVKSIEQLQSDRQKLNQCAIFLRGDPNHQWKKYLQFIQSTIKGFQDFGFIVQRGILRQICLVFKLQFLHLELTKIASAIFNYMICENSIVPIARNLSDYGLIPDLLRGLTSDKSYETITQQLHLVGNMIGENGYIRNIFVHEGWMALMVQFLNTNTSLKHSKQMLMWILSNTVLHYKKKQHNLKFDASKIFAPYLLNYFQYGENMTTRKIALEGLKSLASNKQSSMQRFLMQNGGLSYMIQILRDKQQTLKLGIWRLLFILSKGKNIEFHNCIIGMGILDTMNQILSINANYGNRQQIQKLLVNMSSVSSSIAEAIIVHPLFNHSIQRCKIIVDQKQRLRSLSFVEFVLSYAPSYHIQNILASSSLLMHTMNNLDISVSPQILLVCLKIVKFLIQIFENIYTPNGINKLISKLESVYRFSKVIQSLIMNVQSHQVEQICRELYDKVVETYNL